jgi:hypothetical protein
MKTLWFGMMVVRFECCGAEYCRLIEVLVRKTGWVCVGICYGDSHIKYVYAGVARSSRSLGARGLGAWVTRDTSSESRLT